MHFFLLDKSIKDMLEMGFETIAEAVNVKLSIPKGTPYSFYDSPYIGHRKTTAVDIYFKDREALLPVNEAKVKEIRWFNAPKYRDDGWEREPLILFEINENIVLKVLHVNPKVNVGEKLSLGDFIGECIVSGYLCPWSDSHAHFEIRPSKDPYRARGAYTLSIEPTVSKIKNICQVKSNMFTIVEIKKHYMWVKPHYKESSYLTPLTAKIGNIIGYIDAGVPHYGMGGVIFKNNVSGKITEGNEVKCNSSSLGYVIIINPLSVLFIAPIEVFINGRKARGIGTYINGEYLKVIPIEKGPWKEGDEILLETRIAGLSK